MTSLHSLLNRIEENLGNIYVRDYKDGKMGNWTLDELPVDQAVKHIFRWIRELKEAE